MSGTTKVPGVVAVLGGGTMGRGIAQAAAQAGCRVWLRDLDDRLLAEARDGIRGTLDGGVERGKVSAEERDAALARLETTTEVATAVSGADLVIEAVPERLDLKRAVMVEVDAAAPSGAILASNTSSLSIDAIAGATSRPAKVLGMHFFNPVHRMRLVELVRGPQTEDGALAVARALTDAMGKTAIVVTDTPGFASSRLGLVLGLEAMRMVEQGVAAPEDIDRAMELGYNHPMGPLRLTDLVGLDVRLAIAEYLHRALGGDQYEPPEILRRKVAEGKLGKKSGEGFYTWS
ncbi:MAG: 3-hydroxyacyl-CoA dehydrogenase family protein [Acidobacteriota bacterium]